MKKTLIAVITIVVLVLCGVSAYAIQGLDESKSTTILATDGYATLTTNTVGGTVNTTTAALQDVVNNAAYEGLHVTDTNSVFSMDKAFIQSLLENVSGTVVSFRFGYDGTKTVVTFQIKDGNDTDVFAKAGRCVGKMPHEATSATAVSDLVMVNGSNKSVALTTYYADAKEIHWQLTSGGSYTITTKSTNFTDTKDHWASRFINFLTSHGVVAGMTETTFEPNGTLTRAQFVTLLAHISMVDPSGYTVDQFSDVKTGSWYYHNVAWAYQTKVVSGTSPTTFSPEAKINRQEMAKMTQNFLNYMGVAATPIRSAFTFTDADKISSWAKTSVETVQTAAIISGYEDGRFEPFGTATRGEAATVCSLIISYMMVLPQ